jgi:hypothetical protein
MIGEIWFGSLHKDNGLRSHISCILSIEGNRQYLSRNVSTCPTYVRLSARKLEYTLSWESAERSETLQIYINRRTSPINGEPFEQSCCIINSRSARFAPALASTVGEPPPRGKLGWERARI